jgi:hypothetical protein
LDQFARQLPATTAPAGYCCPSCKKGLFPATNLVSPVADVLREVLAGVNWARAGLGLPLVSIHRRSTREVFISIFTFVIVPLNASYFIFSVCP